MAANNLVNTKMDVILAMVQRELKESASLLPFTRDFSAMAVKGAKSISVPKLSSFVVGDRTFGATGTETAALTDSVDVINRAGGVAVAAGRSLSAAQSSSARTAAGVEPARRERAVDPLPAMARL